MGAFTYQNLRNRFRFRDATYSAAPQGEGDISCVVFRELYVMELSECFMSWCKINQFNLYMKTRQDNEDMINRVALRDRRAFEALYSSTSAKLLGIVLRVVRDRAVADEVLQKVYLRL
ncbi:MAG: hypothetical protein ACI9RO_000061 [Alteromonas macleodii]|jgi:hypothetical protein